MTRWISNHLLRLIAVAWFLYLAVSVCRAVGNTPATSELTRIDALQILGIFASLWLTGFGAGVEYLIEKEESA